MFILREIILLLIPAGWFAALELSRQNTELFWYLVPLAFVQQIITVWYLAKFRFNFTTFIFLISPIIFAFSSLLISLFLVNEVLFYVISAGGALILYIILKQYQLYFRYPFKYQPYTLESLSMYTSIVSVFFLACSAYGLLLFTGLDWQFVLLGLSLIVGLLCYQFFWINKIESKKSLLFSFVITLIEMEVFFAVTYFPTSYFVSGFILASIYYAMLGFSKYYIQNTLSKARVWGYLIVLFVTLLGVIITAQWS